MKKEFMIRISEEMHNEVKEKAKKYNTTISNMIRILIFINSNYFDDFLKKKITKKDFIEDRNVLRKKVAIFLTEDEYELIKKIAKTNNKANVSNIIRSFVFSANKRYLQSEVDKKIKFMLELDKLNLDFSNYQLLNKLFKIYNKTNLNVIEILNKLLNYFDENKIIEILENDKKDKTK